MKHGTTGAYYQSRCRCDECRAAHRVRMRRYRAAKQWKGEAFTALKREMLGYCDDLIVVVNILKLLYQVRSDRHTLGIVRSPQLRAAAGRARR